MVVVAMMMGIVMLVVASALVLMHACRPVLNSVDFGWPNGFPAPPLPNGFPAPSFPNGFPAPSFPNGLPAPPLPNGLELPPPNVLLANK